MPEAPGKDAARLYQPRIRALAKRVRADRRLPSPDATVTCRSPLCGSTLTLDVTWRDGRVEALGWRSRACTLGMASTAIAAEAAIGRRPEEIAEAESALRKLLDGKAATFAEPWSELSLFTAARTFPTRHGSILLPFETLALAWEKSRAA